MNEQDGNDIQENKSVLVPTAESDLLQASPTTASTPTPSATPLMHNSVNLDVSASEEIVADVGVNAAAGAFNLQMNSSVVAAAGDLLSKSAADIQQDAQLNASVLQDAVNDVVTNIVVDEVYAKVGINAVSGVGNKQNNSFTITRPY